MNENHCFIGIIITIIIFILFTWCSRPSYEPFYLEYDPQEYCYVDASGHFYFVCSQDAIDWDNCMSIQFKHTDSLFDAVDAARRIILDSDFNHQLEF